ncbi:MAG: hypothetical protein JO039_11375 [Solirubrobacterales bacterium]|nr:hypothetical protein [Solirubrobacterales bacterium]
MSRDQAVRAVEAPHRPSEQEELQALIEEARRRARRRRRRYAITLVVAVLAAGALYLVLASGDGGAGVPTRGPQAAGVGPQAFGPGRFWYTRTISTERQWLPAGGMTIDRRGYTHRHGPNVQFKLRISDETWVGVDGTIRERMIVAGARFASAADHARWVAYGRRLPNFNDVWLGWIGHDQITVGGDKFPPLPWYQVGEWTGPSGKDIGDGLFRYRQLLSLPTRPAAMRARLRQAEAALARREARTAGANATDIQKGAFADLSEITGLLTSPLPAAERLALFRAAVTIPGASVNARARDSLGRQGVAISASGGVSFQQLIIEPASGALLEDAPKVAVVAQGVVGSPYALPKGVSPVRAPGAPPQPQTPAITPRIGNPTTVFTLRLSADARGQSRQPPRLEGLLIGTPGPQCFATSAPAPIPLVASASVRRASRFTDVYRLSPISVHRRTWCPGRYELTVLPNSADRLPSPSPGAGSSIYFEVRPGAGR